MNHTPEHLFGSASPEAAPTSDTNQEGPAETMRAYQNIPINERNWRRDRGFQLLADSEKQHELIEEAVRDVRNLSVTIRHAISDDTRLRRLRDLLAEIETELQKDQYDAM